MFSRLDISKFESAFRIRRGVTGSAAHFYSAKAVGGPVSVKNPPPDIDFIYVFRRFFFQVLSGANSYRIDDASGIVLNFACTANKKTDSAEGKGNQDKKQEHEQF